jgi:lysophospholipase L1-like esterase
MESRREFIRKAALGGMAAVGATKAVPGDFFAEAPKKIIMTGGNVILFQGDSITDAGRNREDMNPNSQRALGTGYAMLTAASLMEKYASLDLKVYNRGISGNKVYQLAERWDKDCIELKPAVLSILIGVNDFWHKFNGQYDGTPEIYRKDYIALLERTTKALPGIRLVLCEPFAVNGVKAVNDKWFPEFYEYQKAAREIATMFDAVFVPFQKAFDDAVKRAPAAYWTGDGVHASFVGAKMMSETWLKTVKL